MSFKLSLSSLKRLETCDDRLQQVALRAIAKGVIDFGVSYGWRGEREQNALFDAVPKKSKKRWPDSKHNAVDVLGEPRSLAFDLYPYIRANGKGFTPWSDPRYWHMLAGVILATAEELIVPIRWGGDWDSDTFYGDQTFDDLGHFEIKDGQ